MRRPARRGRRAGRPPRWTRPTAELDQAIDEVKAELDSLSELGETESLRLQMAMDRMSKLMSTLSNILKKVSDDCSQPVAGSAGGDNRVLTSGNDAFDGLAATTTSSVSAATTAFSARAAATS